MNYQAKNIAVFGVSQNPSKYGYKIFSTLHELGMSVYGLNPKGGEINGHPLFKSLTDIPVQIEVAILVIPPAGLEQAVSACIEKGVQEIWFQPGAQLASAFEKAQAAGLKAINGCFMAENGFW